LDIPPDLRYTEEHEWADVGDGTVRVGITAYAADQLGDIVYVELPKVGAQLKRMAAFGVVESVKAASDLYSPLTGKVVDVNERLAGAPELVNEDPFGEGWMLVMEVAEPDELETLLDAAAYTEIVAADD
jgi:glycine cleavage system H protein